ncbi:pro-cathepsin H-like [Dromiciops gliroides]|uniref:pro-cathepsin H-like n=1 Tax=Dromiciops gliroides TaxID=33562 RepID=UPI001CC7A954|nr:pro-cathepsin H-like [Dromiciops gliroides]
MASCSDTGASSLPSVSAEEEIHFQSWMKQYNKKYDSSEYHHRLHIFLENKRKIDEHNAGNHSFTMGLNQFSAMTHDEFKNTYLNRARQINTVHSDKTRIFNPDEVDRVADSSQEDSSS